MPPIRLDRRVNPHLAVLDVDGVLLNFDESFAEVAAHALGRPVSRRSNAYRLVERYGLTQNEFSRAWSAMDDHPSGWSNLKIIEGAPEAVQTLRDLGLSIRIATGIHERVAEQRLANLERAGIRVDGIDCVGEGQQSKRAALLRHRPVMFVDDRLALLHEADFVPYRVWVDHGDSQDGHVPHEDLIQVDGLPTWVDQFSRLTVDPAFVRAQTCIGPSPQASLTIVPSSTPRPPRP